MTPAGWDPDAVAPPLGDVYEREAQLSAERRGWALVALCAVLVALALWGRL